MKFFIISLLFILLAVSSTAELKADSLRTELLNANPGSLQIQHYIQKIQEISPVYINTIQMIGDWVITNTNTDSLRELQAKGNFLMGKAYATLLNFEKATKYFTQALLIAEQYQYYAIKAETLNSLGAIYDRNEQNDKAVDYYRQANFLSKEKEYERGIALSTYSLGNVLFETKNTNRDSAVKALNMIRYAYRTMTILKDTQSIIQQSIGLANAYSFFKQFDSASFVLAHAEKLIRKSGREFAYIFHYSRVAGIYAAKKKYLDAIGYYNTGLTLAYKYNIPRWKCMYYTGLAETYERMGDYKRANEFNQRNIQMHDELVNQENFIAAADIQNRYERAKKDNEILQLAVINKQKSILNLVLACSVFCMLLIGTLGYMNVKKERKLMQQQQIIQKQKIKDFEKDKQLLAVNAMLKGQEEERSRIAKELHDGLGGLLSGTRMSFNNIKEKIFLEPQHATQFDKSLSMLDHTIHDLRKVAHNLMPEALTKYGLHDTLIDFCNNIQLTSGIKVMFQQYGKLQPLGNTATVFIYRIIQELVNNVMKHAAATEVIVQLAASAGKLSITVEDNGKGFNKEILQRKEGAGISNVRYRVQYFNGNFDIATSPGNGTSVSIELNTD